MADEKDAERSSNDIRKLVLKPRERIPVETSQGAFFVRHMTISDGKSFNEYFDEKKEKESTNLKALGQRLLRVLVCVDKEVDKTQALTDEIYSRLSADDIKALAEGVGKACGAILSPSEQPLEELGSVVFNKMVEQAKRLAESTAAINRTLDSNFGSISARVKVALGENLVGMFAIRESLRMSPAVEAMSKIQKDRDQLLGDFAKGFTGSSIASEVLRKFQEDDIGMSAIRENFRMSPVVEAMSKIQKDRDQLLGGFTEGLAGSSIASEALRKFQEDEVRLTSLPKDFLSQIDRTSDFSAPFISEHHLPTIVRMEETPMGRAAIASEESALQLQEVSGLVGQMTEQLGKLHTLFLVDVIPQWVHNLEEGAKSTNTSIGLAKKAIYWSIGVTVLMTCWQLWMAREYKLENDKQQEASEALVRKQLEVAQQLNKQLAADSTQLREELSRLSQTIAELHAPKAIEESRSKAYNLPR